MPNKGRKREELTICKQLAPLLQAIPVKGKCAGRTAATACRRGLIGNSEWDIGKRIFQVFNLNTAQPVIPVRLAGDSV